MIINHNLSAINSSRNLKFNNIEADKSIQKLASGLRINFAADGASDLVVSEKMRAQIRGLKRAAMNAEDGISLLQTAEGYLDSTTSLLQKIRELAVQASNGIYTAVDRTNIQLEVSVLIDEVDRIASHAQFNTLNLLTGRYADPAKGGSVPASMWFHIGANMDQRERVYIGTMDSKALGLKNISTNSIITLSTQNNANMAIGIVDEALLKVSRQRATLGAYQNRMEFATKAILIGYENLQASESRIRDTNMAEEVINFTRSQILTQAANSMLAQANVKPQLVLQLLR